MTGRISARVIAGGEGQGVRGVQRVDAHLLEVLGVRESERRGFVGGEQGAAAAVVVVGKPASCH